jgi:hypothetical protein
MWNRLAAVIFTGALALQAQDLPFDPHSSIQINLPPDSPVTLLSTNVGESRATPRGGAMVVDLHMSLSLRNAGSRNIRGVTLLVTTQEMTPGGKASVAVPSLNIASSQTFPIRIDLRLLRPLQAGGGPLVKVSLDGVLFEGFDFYGPNRLNSRRSMTVWEMEAEGISNRFSTQAAPKDCGARWWIRSFARPNGRALMCVCREAGRRLPRRLRTSGWNDLLS